MGKSEQVYWRIVELYIAPLMKELGFEQKRKGWFYAIRGDCTLRLACGFNKQRGEESGSMTVTVCVGFPRLEEFLSTCAELANYINVRMDKLGCTMATDLGHLTSPHRYLSWEISELTDIDAVGLDISTRIRTDGLKYFADYGSLDQAIAAWRSGTTFNLGTNAVLYLAAYEWLFGNRKNALFQLSAAVASAELPSTRNVYSSLLNWLKACDIGEGTRTSQVSNS